jgi:hypothetical protein
MAFLYCVTIPITAGLILASNPIGDALVDEDFPTIDASIKELKQWGYTGAGVSVGVIDTFKLGHKEQFSHGEWVAAYLKKVAPGIIMITQQSKRPAPYPALTKRMDLKAVNTVRIILLKKEAVKNVDEVLILTTYEKAPTCYPDKFEAVEIPQGQKLTLSAAFEEDIPNFYMISFDGKEYYAPLTSFVGGDFNLVLDRDSFLSDIDQSGGDGGIANYIHDLQEKGVRIITTSIGYVPTESFDQAVQRLGQVGGVFFQAAGNTDVKVAATEVPLRSKELSRLNRTIIARTGWRQRVERGLEKGTCVAVGALKNATELADYSNKAALVKNAFINVAVTGFGAQGTSLAAPQLAGVVALLQEAFPNCAPKLLSKALIKTDKRLPGDPEGEKAGKGAINPTGAFAKAKIICKAEPVPPKGG